MVIEEENAGLEKEYTEDEIKRVVFESFPEGGSRTRWHVLHFLSNFLGACQG
jgi:hypothetical protein